VAAVLASTATSRGKNPAVDGPDDGEVLSRHVAAKYDSDVVLIDDGRVASYDMAAEDDPVVNLLDENEELVRWL
jgi:hypothetical protein